MNLRLGSARFELKLSTGQFLFRSKPFRLWCAATVAPVAPRKREQRRGEAVNQTLWGSVCRLNGLLEFDLVAGAGFEPATFRL